MNEASLVQAPDVFPALMSARMFCSLFVRLLPGGLGRLFTRATRFTTCCEGPRTVMVKVPFADRPAALTAWQLTVAVPTPKSVPGPGAQVRLGLGSTLSVAVAV